MSGAIRARLSAPVTACPLIPRRDFLPRGSGIVTRRPLILQLIFSKTGTLRPRVPSQTWPETHPERLGNGSGLYERSQSI